MENQEDLSFLLLTFHVNECNFEDALFEKQYREGSTANLVED